MPDHYTYPGTEVLVNIPGYTDPAACIDLQAGLPALREPWIAARGDTEQLRAMMAAGLTPGAPLRLDAVDAALGTLTVWATDHTLTLSLGVAAQIHVQTT